MLIKLLKYEIVSEWKKYAVTYIGMLILAVSILIASKELERLGENSFAEMLQSLLMNAFALLSFAAFVMVLVFATLRFYKNMFRDEGYLMHTLPVSAMSHILSKLASTYIWFMLTSAVFMLSLCIAKGSTEPLNGLLSIKMYITDSAMNDGIVIADSSDLETFIKLCNSFLVKCAVAGFFTAPILFQILMNFCIAFGNLFNRHKIPMAVVTFVGINLISNIISGIIMTCAFRDAESATSAEVISMFTDGFIINAVVFAVIYAAMFCATHFIMDKKLNLE